MVCCGTLLQREAMEEVEDEECEAIEQISANEDNDDNFFENFETIFDDEEFNICISQNFSSLTCLRCAAHTVQLSVSDVLKNVEIKQRFEECRSVMKKLRTPAMYRLLSSQNLMPPLVDCTTRWSYSYELLKRLRNLEIFILENIKESKIDWTFVDSFLSTFSCFKKLTEQLQNKNLLFGDFIKYYLEMYLHVKRDSETSHISKLLLQSLNQRKHNLLQNQTVAAAMYLDPRLRRLLQLPEFANLKPVAVAHLKALYSRMHGTGNSTPESFTTNSVESSEDGDNLLNTLMSQIGHSETDVPSRNEAFSIIENFNESSNLNTNLQDFWEPKRFSHSTLYQLYQIIHATPATQVSVERAFSTLKYIINDFRAALSDNLTEAILILRLN